MKAVRPYSFKGKVLCKVINLMACTVHIFKRKEWDKALEFEENPLTMRAKDILYFAYKYYFRPPHLPSDPEIIRHFNQKAVFKKSQNAILTISLGGDLMPYEMIKPEYTNQLWDEVGVDFFGSDIVFANLETPLDITRKASFVPEVMLSNMLFNTNQETFNIFNGNGHFKGYDILSIANNHSLDMGKTGLLNTIAFLNEQNIKTVGASASEVKSKEPVIIEKNGIKTGFIAYTYSLNQFEAPEDYPWLVNLLPLNKQDCNISLIREHVKICKNAGAELIICSIHAGNAYQIYPGETTIKLFQKIFSECGVDVIVGGHPHNLQPWRDYDFKDPYSGKQKKGFAIYSLADFVAYDIFTWCHLCAYLKLEIGRDETGELTIHPIVIPLIMERKNKMLRLKFADRIFLKSDFTEEEKDLKILYDICIHR